MHSDAQVLFEDSDFLERKIYKNFLGMGRVNSSFMRWRTLDDILRRFDLR